MTYIESKRVTSHMIRRFVKSVAFTAIFLLISCAEETSQELMAKAQQDFAAGDYTAANIALKNAALKEPDNAEVRLQLAVVSLIFGDGASAEKEARRAVELGIPADRATIVLLRAIYLQGELERVLAESETIPENLDPKIKADAMAYRAHALIAQQQFKLAESTIEQALALNEESVLAILAKAHYEAQLGRRETAMALAKRAVEIDASYSEVWALIGDLNAADGKLAEAKEAYDKAVANLQYVGLVSARRAYVAAQLGDFDTAQSDIEVLYTNGYRSQAYVNFVEGYIEFRQANYPAATAALEKSIASNPDDPLVKLYLAASYIQEGKLEQARVVANQLYYAIPNSVEIARLLASLSIKQQDFGAAKSTLNTLLEVNEDDTVALGMLGTIALMEGKADESVAHLERLATLSPDNDSVKSMLNLARTMRGDYVTELTATAEQDIPPEEMGQALLSAATALKQGQLKEALTIAENLQQQFPGEVAPVNMLATIYLSVGDWRKGKELLEKALTIEPMNPSALKSLAKIQLRIGEAPRAKELISAYLKEHPEDEEAIGIQSEVIVATESYPQAETQLTELLEKAPDNLELRGRLVKLYFDNGKFEQVSVRTENLEDDQIQSQPSLMELRGKSLYMLGNTEGAAKTWERWVKLAPDSVLAHFYYADSLAKSNKLTQAIEALEVCKRLKPSYLPARLDLIRISAEAGDTDKAVAEMASLQAEMQEDRADVWYTQGWLNAKIGKYPAAEEALRKSLAIEPSPETAMLLFASLNSQGKTQEALATLEEWVGKLPKSSSLMVVLGQSYLARKETDKAIGIYERILALDPDSVLALNNLAWLKREQDAKQALVYAERASALAPEDPYVMSTHATLLAGNGQAAAGEEMMRKAVVLHPDDLQVKLALGRLLLDLGKTDDAKPYLEEVVGSDGSAALVAEAKDLLEAAKQKGGG
jgi:putative PEP-CTERM system TPR-repeat lipoprotein